MASTKYVVFKKDSIYRIEKKGFHYLVVLLGFFYLPFKGLWKQFFLYLFLYMILVFGFTLTFIKVSPSLVDLSSALTSLGFMIFIGYKTYDWLEEKYISQNYQKIKEFSSKEEAKAFVEKESASHLKQKDESLENSEK